MAEPSLTIALTVDRPPGAVFDAVNDVRGWWSESLEGRTDHIGDEFVYRVEGIHYSKIRVVELVPDALVVWRVLDNHLSFVTDQSEWIGSEIRFEMATLGHATELRFTHVGLVASHECYEACSDGWGFYIGTSLHDLITTGTGKPNSLPAEIRLRNDSGRADSDNAAPIARS